MDESDTLDSLASILSELEQTPYDVALHAKHICLAQSADGFESQVHAARETFTHFMAAGDDVWIPLIEAKETSVDLNSKAGLEEVLVLYLRAEEDYLCACWLFSQLAYVQTLNSHSIVAKTPQLLGRSPCTFLRPGGNESRRLGRDVLH
jgi:hypothetical protein